MFMRLTQRKRTSDPPGGADAAPPQTPQPGGAPPDDAKSAETERLEQALAEERQHATTLRATVEELRFKITILEKSYAKQLADARTRAEVAERGLTEEKARLAGIDGDHANTLQLLTETRGQLAKVAAECDLLRKQAGSGNSRRTEPAAVPYHVHAPAPAPESELTINTLMADLTKSVEERRSPPPSSSSQQRKPVEEPPAEDMIPADLVFPKRRDDKDGKGDKDDDKDD